MILDYETLDALLDKAAANQVDWLVDLQSIRVLADDAYNAGALAQYQWQALVTRSVRIQDVRNDARLNEISKGML